MTRPIEGVWLQGLTDLAASQVRPIVAEFAKGGTQIDGVVASDGGVDFMFESGYLLVRDQGDNVDQIGAAVGQPDLRHRAEPVINGLVRVPLDIAALEIIEARFGTDQVLAKPNHVMTTAGPDVITPWPVTPCPATEPEVPWLWPWPRPRIHNDGGGSGVKIYIADTGLLQDADLHPWLNGVRGEDDPVPDPEHIPAYAGHGTFVAGITRSQASAADIYVEAVFDKTGSELESEAIKRLDAALDQNYDIFNVTATTTTRNDKGLLAFEVWLDRFRSHDTLVCIVPAGNDNSTRPHWPAAFSQPGLISVGATTLNGRQRAVFSDYGDWVDVYSPGEYLVNAYARGTYTCQWPPEKDQRRHFWGMAQWSGTSFSTPIVSGLIAARMRQRAEHARQAGEALLAQARKTPVAGVGPVLMPRPADGWCRQSLARLAIDVQHLVSRLVRG